MRKWLAIAAALIAGFAGGTVYSATNQPGDLLSCREAIQLQDQRVRTAVAIVESKDVGEMRRLADEADQRYPELQRLKAAC